MDFSIYDNIILGNQREAPFYSGLLLHTSRINSFAEQKIKDYDIMCANPALSAHCLSGGNLQKLILAREMSANPKCLIAGQPTRGLDVGAIEYVHQMLLELRKAGAGILLISEELDEILRKYADARRTVIDTTFEDLTYEDLIAEEDMVVTISHSGAIKRLPVSQYRTQNRGGRGSTGAKTKDEDFIEHVFVAGTHDYILFFTDFGKCYWLKVYSIPPASKISKGRPIINLIDISKGERVRAFITVEDYKIQDGVCQMIF